MRRGFRRTIETLDEVFRFLEDFAAANALPERAAFTLNLVAEELFTNMIRHGVGGGDSIDLGVERIDGAFRLEMVDTDVEPFDPLTVPTPPVEAGIDERTPGGLGIHLVQTMVDDLSYDYDPASRRMRVSVTGRWEG